MEGNIRFRPMALADLDAVEAIEWASFPAPWSRQAFASELVGNRYAHYVVAERDGSVVGYAGMWVMFDEAHITNIAVAPDCRRQNVGGGLLEALMSEARERGAKMMTLEVRRSNAAAQALYRKYGFVPRGVRKGYYSDAREDAIVMTRREI